jgi:hypothetical protein
MIHACVRCESICSDELNDFGLDEDGNPVCEACQAEEVPEKLDG